MMWKLWTTEWRCNHIILQRLQSRLSKSGPQVKVRLSTVAKASVTTPWQISDDRAQHGNEDHGDTENEVAVKPLKHTTVVQTSSDQSVSKSHHFQWPAGSQLQKPWTSRFGDKK